MFRAAFVLLTAASLVVDPSEYRTVDQAVRITVKPAAGTPGQTGYLGVSVERNTQGQLVVAEVQPDSPGAKAGVKKGDVVTRVGEHAVQTPDAFREWVQTHNPEETVKLVLVREGKPVEVSATLAATSRPKKAGSRVYLGLELGAPKEGEGVVVSQVAPNSPAANAGLKPGDLVVKIDGGEFRRAGRLTDLLGGKRPGDTLLVTVHRDGKDVELKATLTSDQRGREALAPVLWKKERFRLGVVLFEFPDVKHNAKVPAREWQELLFSRGVYTMKENATGQKVYGSLADYFAEQSAGAFELEGRVFDWVELSKKRGEYVQGSGTSNRTAPLAEAVSKLEARDGKDVLKGLDGLLFVYAGELVRGNRGSVYYPHAGVLRIGERLPYLLQAEGGTKMTTVGGLVKPMAQALGLPDLAARPEDRGSEGLGPWCALSDPSTDSRPQHLGAWAKEKMGWIHPVTIDPSVKQKLVLAPIEDSPKECIKVLVRPDGSEYFLLENRRKRGFDTELSGEGLLIWRVVHDRPVLEESHGVEGPSGPTVHLAEVPYPSQANNAFTPETTPSSRSPLGGGLPVWITEIRRLPDGRVAFQIGYEYR